MRDKLILGTLLAAVLLAVLAVVAVRLHRPPETPAPPVVQRPAAHLFEYRPAPPPRYPQPAERSVVAAASASAPVLVAASEVAAATSPAPPDDFADLQWIHCKYIYENFTQLGNLRVGKMFNHETRQTSTVREGDPLEAGSGVTVVSLDAEKAVVRLRAASDTMLCTGNPKYDFLTEWQRNPQPPSDEQRRMAFEVYMAQHGLRTNLLAMRAGRPAAPAWHEKTEEEMANEMRHYLATTGPEAEKRQNEGYLWRQPDPRLLTPEKIQENRAVYYRQMGIAPGTPPIYRDEERMEPREKKLGLKDE